MQLDRLRPDHHGDGTFDDVTPESISGWNDCSTAAAFGDFDGDGLLDLYVVKYVADWNRVCRNAAGDLNHQQRGDPAKFAKAMMILADAPNPPVRLPLGSDTVKRIEAKNAEVIGELTAWRELALSTDWVEPA